MKEKATMHEKSGVMEVDERVQRERGVGEGRWMQRKSAKRKRGE